MIPLIYVIAEDARRWSLLQSSIVRSMSILLRFPHLDVPSLHNKSTITTQLVSPGFPPERQHQNFLYRLPPSSRPQSSHSAPSNYPPRPPTPHPLRSPLRSQSSSLLVHSHSPSPAH